MAYKDFVQPQIINIDNEVRLRAYDGNYQQAILWYQDEVVYYNSEGITDSSKIPDESYVKRMYEYLNNNGELYFIEIHEDGKYIPIGDVTLKEQNPPIAIGVAKYRGKGIGTKVMKAIIKRAKEIGMTKFYGTTIYDYNIASQRMHEALGYKCVEIKGKDRIYELEL
jgi:RimJ/RimL family protein N-acetyltransferase